MKPVMIPTFPEPTPTPTSTPTPSPTPTFTPEPTATPYKEPQLTELEVTSGVAVTTAIIGAGLGLSLYLIKRK